MKKAKQMQAQMEQAQADLLTTKITGESGGGLVKIIFNGRHEALSTHIDDSVMDDKLLLCDLITASINDAAHKIERQTKTQLSSLTAGLNLPTDFKMPFGDKGE
jgi:nucleoid-associated protein EbfC